MSAELPTYPLPTLLARQNCVLRLLVDLDPGNLLPKQCGQITDGIMAHMTVPWCRNEKGEEVVDEVLLQQRRRALASVLRPFREQSLLAETQQRLLAKRVAGNWDSLADGVEWRSWENYREPTWTLIWFKDVERRLSLKERQYRCEFEACAGPAAGQVWQQIFSGGFLQLLMREAGVNRYAEWQDTDVGGLWFNCWLRLEGSRVRFRGVKPSSTQLAHNRLLAAGRRALCSGPYVRNGKGRCLNCPVGRAECKLSRHEAPYTTKALCANYELKEGERVRHHGIVTTHSEGVCLYCLNQGAIRKDVVQATLKSHQHAKEKQHVAASSPPTHHPAEGSLGPRFRAWHGAVWQKRPGSVPKPAS